MKNDDVELIHRVLDGDDTAFTELVEKYRKSVHALAWRKVRDFHIAEEITQDTFLKAYQELGNLKKPQSFAGWLYVIVSRRCVAWSRKKRVRTQSLEETNSLHIEKATYSQHVIEENERIAAETQREVVKKLLAKLPESERTVITLHYFSEMSSAEIGAFLGVSANTIRSRLRRAQQRLQKEETMIREALEHFQISPNLTDNIMQEIARLKPGTPTGSKPFVPWAIAASSVILIVLMLGIGSQYLAHFQKPYSLDAQAEMVVDIVETPIVVNLDTEPEVRQLGNINALGKSDNRGDKPDEILLAAAQTDGEDISIPKQQWIQAEPIKGSPLMSILGTSEGDIYVLGEELNLYKLPADGENWQQINDLSSIITEWIPSPPMAMWKNTLYIIGSNKLFASNDDGNTWDSVHSWQNEEFGPNTLILTEDAFYIGFLTGIFRSVDNGKTWEKISDGLMGNIRFLVNVQGKLITGTDNGLYRLGQDSWKRLEFPVATIGRFLSVASTEKNLYVAAEFSWEMVEPQKVFRGQEKGWWIFRSTDFGDTWKDITPTNAWPQKAHPPHIALIAFGETLLAIDQGMVRSTDAGDTWMHPHEPRTSSTIISQCRAVAVNEGAFYIGSEDGLHRSIDGGKSWDKVNIPQEKEMSPIDTLIAYKEDGKKQNILPTLYARFGGEYGRVRGEIAKTSDKGKSWNTIQMDIPMMDRAKEGLPDITQIVKSGDSVYAKEGTYGRLKTLLYRLSEDGNTLVPIQDIPLFDKGLLRSHYMIPISYPLTDEYKKSIAVNSFGAAQFFKQLTELDSLHSEHIARSRKSELFDLGSRGPFAVSGDTFYIEYNFKIYRCKQGDTEWYDTEQEETVELTTDIVRRVLKLAVSGNTVYVGKRDGHLVVSFDRGTNWMDLTPALPFPVKTFKDIVVAGSTVYVATDAGIITSRDGRQWHTIVDADGTNPIMEHLAVNATTLYGVTKKTGAYRLENGTWELIISDIPDNVTSLAVDGNTLYIGTENNEVLHFNLEE